MDENQDTRELETIRGSASPMYILLLVTML